VSIQQLSSTVRTAIRLGPWNVFRAAAYRGGIRFAFHPVCRVSSRRPSPPFFAAPRIDPPASAPADWNSVGYLFGYQPFEVPEAPPDWHPDPFGGGPSVSAVRPWWQIPDFNSDGADIKRIWELSRMDWVPAFAQQATAGNAAALERLNCWLADWCGHNPPYAGENWKCGQEASIRVMHLALAALVLGQTRETEAGLHELVRMHLRRIAPTVGYAMAQDNNHGTSEAAALFIGGSWLALAGDREAERWRERGRRMMENRAGRLIGGYGGFSQYSLNYHRLVLDTFSLVEVWRRRLSLPEFSRRWNEKARLAAEWLRNMVEAESGDGPNVGHNDGARLLQLDGSDYRDYRPSVQLATALFAKRSAYGDACCESALGWLGVSLPREKAPPVGSFVDDDGGFALMRQSGATAMLRYPRFRFRPAHADALHLDFWVGGLNLLRDGGSYSYAADPELIGYFSGTGSHNTVQFDGRDQMPRLGRFLFGDWLRHASTEALEEASGLVRFGAGYRDGAGCRHVRRVELQNGRLRVMDEISGFRERAVLRWRLAPGAWKLERDGAAYRVVRTEGGLVELIVRSRMAVIRAELVDGWESRYYLQKTMLPVLEIEVCEPGRVETECRF